MVYPKCELLNQAEHFLSRDEEIADVLKENYPSIYEAYTICNMKIKE